MSDFYVGAFRGYRLFNLGWNSDDKYVPISLNQGHTYTTGEQVAECKGKGHMIIDEKAINDLAKCGENECRRLPEVVDSYIYKMTVFHREELCENYEYHSELVGALGGTSFYEYDDIHEYNEYNNNRYRIIIKQHFLVPMVGISHPEDQVATFKCRVGCGFYGFYDRKGALERHGEYGIFGGEAMSGVCDFYGRIALGTFGMRASKLKIVALHVNRVNTSESYGSNGYLNIISDLRSQGFKVYQDSDNMLNDFPLTDPKEIIGLRSTTNPF